MENLNNLNTKSLIVVMTLVCVAILAIEAWAQHDQPPVQVSMDSNNGTTVTIPRGGNLTVSFPK